MCSSSSTVSSVQLQFTAMRCYAPVPDGGANCAPQTSWLDFGERKGEGGNKGEWKGVILGKTLGPSMTLHTSCLLTTSNLHTADDNSCILLTLSAYYKEQGLCNGRVSVRLSVCPIYRPQQQRAAGLLLGALRAGDRRYRSTGAGARHQQRHSTALSSKRGQWYVYSRRIVQLSWCAVNRPYSSWKRTASRWWLMAG